MQRLLFAIVQGPPVSWRPPRSALGMIETRAFDELVVVSSQLERIPEPNTRTLALHHDVVAATMEADGVLPFRFGTSLDAGELEGWLAAHAARIRAALGQPGAGRRNGGRAAGGGARLPVRCAAGPPACGPRGASGSTRAPHHRLRGSGAGRRLAGPSRFGIPLARISRGTS